MLCLHDLVPFPITLSPSQQDKIEKYGLALQSLGFLAGYDININAGIANSFAAETLKFVASLMPNTVAYCDDVSTV